MRKSFVLAFLFIFLLSFAYAKVEYTPTTRTECSGGVCNQVLYSGIRYTYEDKIWKPIEEARSLKGSGIDCIVQEDGEHIASCLDWNYSSITLEVSKKGSGSAPIRVLREDTERSLETGKKEFEEVKRENYVFDNSLFGLLKDKKQVVVNANYGEVVHFGEHSTTITLQDADTENLGDSFIRGPSSSDLNFGSAINIYTRSGSTYDERAFLKFNLSVVPTNNISSSTLNLYLGYILGSSSRTIRVYNTSLNTSNSTAPWSIGEWVEGSGSASGDARTGTNITWLNQPDVAVLQDSVSVGTSTDVWYSWNILPSTLSSQPDGKISLSLRDSSEGSGTTYQKGFRSKEYSTTSLRPYLNITYTAEACETSLVNTSWSSWSDVGCSGSQMNQSRFLTQYDENFCGEVENTTFYEYQSLEPNYQNTSWTDWTNISCLIDDTMNQSRSLIQYDTYTCASNTTFYDYQNTLFCDYETDPEPQPPAELTSYALTSGTLEYYIIKNLMTFFFILGIIGSVLFLAGGEMSIIRIISSVLIVVGMVLLGLVLKSFLNYFLLVGGLI
jgi:hypothetical protein